MKTLSNDFSTFVLPGETQNDFAMFTPNETKVQKVDLGKWYFQQRKETP